MTDRTKIVVWDSIGNTMMGVRPWSSWEPLHAEQLLLEDRNAKTKAVSFAELFAGRAVELIWFSGADPARPTFSGLTEDFAANIRYTSSLDEITAEIAEADYVVLHKQRLHGEALRGASKLKLIQHLGLDYRGMPMATAHQLGIPAAATPLLNYVTVAEHVWAFVLNWIKRLPDLREHMRARAYSETWGLFPGTRYAGDITLGILGMGEIARPIARIAQAFDMPVLYWDIERFPELEARYNMQFVEWDEIFSRSDVLTVQLALNEQTSGIIGAREIGLMRPDALFINTARGKLVDQIALTDAVVQRRIGGVALDVYAEEPLPIDDRLLALHDEPNGRVTLSPHCAWQSPWTWIRDSQEIWQNVLRSIAGEPIKHLV